MATPTLIPFTVAPVDLIFQDNETWQDAWQFGMPDDHSWDFTGWTFYMDVKGDRDDVSPLFQLTSANGRIRLIDVASRIIQFNANSVDVQAALKPGRFDYDLIGLDTSVPSVRTALLTGRLRLKHGIT